MKRFLNTALAGALIAVFAAGCDDFVQGIDDPIDQIPDPALTDESQVQFLENGIKQRFSLGWGMTQVLAEALSDAYVIGGPNATFPACELADECEILRGNNSSSNANARFGQHTYLAECLIERNSGIGSFESE